MALNLHFQYDQSISLIPALVLNNGLVMNSPQIKTNGIASFWLVLTVAALLLIGVVCWGMWPVNHSATGSSQRDFTMNVDFDKFRQIMVRKNATDAIVAYSGMKILNEKVNDLSVDVPEQNHPVLNAVLGRSKAKVSVSKQLTVSLENPDIKAKEMNLNQYSDIDAEHMDVTTEANEPAGNVKVYSTRLLATKENGGTKVELSINQTVDVRVSQFVISEADRRVKLAAVNSTTEQEKAIRSFISLYQDELIVLPELR